jgi:hypothetical protein
MTNYASLRGPLGLNRAFAKVDGPPDETTFLAAVRAGRTFATNAPLLDFSLAGQGIGGEVSRPAGRQRLEAKVHLRSLVPVDHLQIVGNGQVVAEVPLTGPRTSVDATLPVTVLHSGWYTVRAWAENPRHPVLDGYPFATTSPIYVTLGGAPVRSGRGGRGAFFRLELRPGEGRRARASGPGPSRVCGTRASLKRSRTHDLPRPPLRGRRALL